jgi:hypothetical protein
MYKPYKVAFWHANGANTKYFDNYFKAEGFYFKCVTHCERLKFSGSNSELFSATVKIENLQTFEVYRIKIISNIDFD